MKTVKIGIISDTHNYLGRVQCALEKMGSIDILLHCGDHYRDALQIEEKFQLKTLAVRGNCDDSLGSEEEIFSINSYNILLTHGHKYSVKKGLNNLFYRCKEKEIALAIYGHTHLPSYIMEDGIHLLNPGSLSLPRGGNPPSCALLTIGEKIDVNFLWLVK